MHINQYEIILFYNLDNLYDNWIYLHNLGWEWWIWDNYLTSIFSRIIIIERFRIIDLELNSIDRK